MDLKNFYFCYSDKLLKFLRYEKDLKFLITARHIETNNQFWLFNRTQELEDALTEWSKNGKNNTK